MIGDTTIWLCRVWPLADYFDYPASLKRRIKTGAAIIPEKVAITSSALHRVEYEQHHDMAQMPRFSLRYNIKPGQVPKYVMSQYDTNAGNKQKMATPCTVPPRSHPDFR